MSGPRFNVGDRIVTGSGRPGTVTAVERVWVTVQFDSDDEFRYCFHAFDKWIQPHPWVTVTA